MKFKVGSEVTVTTKWKSNIHWKEYEENTYSSKVVKSERYDPPDTFRIDCDLPNLPSRLITHRSVINLTVDGKVLDPSVIFDTKPLKTTTKVIAGTGGKFYEVTVVGDKPIKCDCVGFRFHRTCKHLKAAI